MAKNIKGITIELNGDATGLDNAIKGVNKETASLQSELRQVETALKFNPGNMELLAQKSEILGKEIASVSNKLDILKKSKEQVDQQFANGEISDEQYRAFNREIIKTESQLDSLEKSLDENDKAMKNNGKTADEAKSKFNGLGSVLGTVAKTAAAALAAMGVAAVGATTALVNMSVKGAAYADDVLTASTVTGIATDKLQAYGYAAGLVDVEVETLTGSMAKNIKSMTTASKGTGDVAAAYQKLGVQVTNADGSLRDSETVYWETIDALKGIADETERDSLAMQLFGKSAQDLNPLIQQGSEGMAALTEEAKEMGAVMSEDTLKAFGEFDDNIQRLKSGWSALSNVGGSLLLPMLNDLSGEGVELLGNFTKALSEAGGDPEKMQEAVSTAISGIINAINTYLPQMVQMGMTILKSIIGGISQSIPSIVSSATQILTMLSKTLLESLPLVVSAALQIIIALANGISGALPELIPAVVDTIMAIVAELINNLPLLIDAALELITALGQGILDSIPILIDMLPKLIDSMLKFFSDNLPEILNQGIDILLALIDGIIDALPLLIEALPKIIDNFVKFITENLPTIIQQGIEILMKLINGILQALPELIKALPEIILTITKTLIENLPLILQMGLEILWELIKGIIKAIPDLVKAIPDIIMAIVDAFTGYVDTFSDIGSDIVDGIWKGIKDGWDWLIGKVKKLASDLLNAAKDVLGINSPSKEFAKLGVFSAQGFGVGFDDEMDAVNREIDHLITANLEKSSLGNKSGTNNSNNEYVINFYPKQMSKAELEMAFDFFNKKFGMAL